MPCSYKNSYFWLYIFKAVEVSVKVFRNYSVFLFFSVNSKSIQNWKQKLIAWNDISSTEISKF